MSDFDAGTFTSELERAGLKMNTIRLADGKYRVNRWRMIGADTKRIDELWAATIGDNKNLHDLLVAHLSRHPPEPLVPASMRRPVPKLRRDGWR
jgi:hypothetical protein